MHRLDLGLVSHPKELFKTFVLFWFSSSFLFVCLFVCGFLFVCFALFCFVCLFVVVVFVFWGFFF